MLKQNIFTSSYIHVGLLLIMVFYSGLFIDNEPVELKPIMATIISAAQLEKKLDKPKRTFKKITQTKQQKKPVKKTDRVITAKKKPIKQQQSPPKKKQAPKVAKQQQQHSTQINLKKKYKPKKQQTNDEFLSSLLATVDTNDTSNGFNYDPNKTLADVISRGEKQNFLRGIAPCWNFPAHAAKAEKLIVKIRARMRADGTVISANIINRVKHPFWQVAARAARQAVLDRSCQPFDLPKNKYSYWQELTLTFDPSGLLGF